ncbi:MAG: ABC transporter permease [Candidatus Thorarchaeota archaeon]|nr:ABC transporter permease [Candidatus Thorarchaeota archaeon]
MKVRDIFSYSFSAIRLRKLRAGLTTLGVVIGIAAIVALMSITQGFQVAMTSQLEEGLASDTLIVGNSRMSFSGPDSDFTLLVNDTDTITKIDGVQTAIPVMSKTCKVYFNSTEYTLPTSGVDFEKYAQVYSTFSTVEGEIPLSSPEGKVVVGHTIADPWKNGTRNVVVGDNITLSWTGRVNGSLVTTNRSFIVAGVLDEIGAFSMGPSDSGIYIPISDAQDFFDTEEVSNIVVKLVNGDETTIDNVTQAIEDAFEDLVKVTSPTAVLDTINNALGMMTTLLVGIAAISLFVAGVGIMNIMIVSLMERTREIGILKGLGMKNRTVMAVFLTEAMLIGLLGAVFGVGLGYFVATIFSRLTTGSSSLSGPRPMSFPSFTPVFSINVLLGAMFFGIVVSVVFGLYPAWRASRLRPVDALRYE